MNPKIVVVDNPTDADYRSVKAPLMAFNQSFVGVQTAERVVIMIKDEAGETVGGVAGTITHDWLYADVLMIPKAWRGTSLGKNPGMSLAKEVEAMARRRGLRGVWGTTFDFQAKRFYERLGGTVRGEIPNCPTGTTMYFMAKEF